LLLLHLVRALDSLLEQMPLQKAPEIIEREVEHCRAEEYEQPVPVVVVVVGGEES